MAHHPDLSSCSEPERFLFDTVIAPVLSEISLSAVTPQYEVSDAEGRSRRLDFAITTEQSRIAIELDGYTYHAEGAISRASFDDQLSRQNELVLDGWRVIRYSWDQVNARPANCRDQLRRAIISDAELHPALRRDSISPHEIQLEALARLKDARAAGVTKALVSLATGLGKTFLAAFDAREFSGRTLFIVHNNEILEQARRAFETVLPNRSSGFYNGLEKSPESEIVFANVCSLRGREGLEQFDPKSFDYIVVDEAHHATTNNYRRVLSHFRPKFLLGLTATPFRTDDVSVLQVFDRNLIYRVTQKEAIDRGFLAPFHYVALLDNVDYSKIRHNGYRYFVEDLNKALIIESRDESILNAYREHAAEGKGIGFCVSIEHAERTADFFNARGIRSAAIHSRLPTEERRLLTEKFRGDQLDVVFVRDVFNEGVDFPDVAALLFLRPTESRLIFIQQLGRGLRLNAGKSGVKVLDFIGNYVHAERTLDYLNELGAEFSEKEEKPLYYYDNGSSVEFEEGVLDTITILDANVLSEGELVSQFFDLVRRIRRPPTFADIHKDQSLEVKEILARFGSWEAFLGRLSMLDDSADLTGLQPPRAGSAEYFEDCAAIFESDFGFVQSSISQLAEGLAILREPILRLGDRLDSVRQDVHGAFFDMRDAVEECRTSATLVTMLLAFKVGAIVSETPSNVRDEYRTLGEHAAQVLGEISNSAEAFVLGRSFPAILSLIDGVVAIASKLEDTGNEVVEEEGALTSVLAGAAELSILLEQIATRIGDVEQDFVDERGRASVGGLLIDIDWLEESQRSLLESASVDLDALITVRSHGRTCGLAKGDARRDLLFLESLGLLDRADVGDMVFVFPEDLLHRLSSAIDERSSTSAEEAVEHLADVVFLSDEQVAAGRESLAGVSALNSRQLLCLERALENTAIKISVESYAETFSTSESVASDDLSGLVDIGLLRGRSGAFGEYNCVANLVEVLRELSSGSPNHGASREIDAVLAGFSSFTTRQLAILRWAISVRPSGFSVSEAAKSLDQNFERVSKDLASLQQRRFIDQSGTPSLEFSAAANLTSLLEMLSESPELGDRGIDQVAELLQLCE